MCAAISFYGFVSDDSKGWFVFLQLPLAPQIELLTQLGLSPALSELGWVGSYLLIGAPTLAALYVAGWLLEKCVRSLN
jgi:hypothetical protein